MNVLITDQTSKFAFNENKNRNYLDQRLPAATQYWAYSRSGGFGRPCHTRSIFGIFIHMYQSEQQFWKRKMAAKTKVRSKVVEY